MRLGVERWEFSAQRFAPVFLVRPWPSLFERLKPLRPVRSLDSPHRSPGPQLDARDPAAQAPPLIPMAWLVSIRTLSRGPGGQGPAASAAVPALVWAERSTRRIRAPAGERRTVNAGPAGSVGQLRPRCFGVALIGQDQIRRHVASCLDGGPTQAKPASWPAQVSPQFQNISH